MGLLLLTVEDTFTNSQSWASGLGAGNSDVRCRRQSWRSDLFEEPNRQVTDGSIHSLEVPTAQLAARSPRGSERSGQGRRPGGH